MQGKEMNLKEIEELEALLPSNTELRKETGNKIAAQKRKVQWANNTNRRIKASEIIRKTNKKLYGGYKWIVCSPGNDMLAYYDRMNEELGVDNRAHSAIPPSVVYHYRFEHEYPAFKRGANRPGRNTYLHKHLKHFYDTDDGSYYGQVYATRYDWLVDKPHEEWAFDTRDEMLKFLKEKFPNRTFNIQLGVHHHITKNSGSTKITDMKWRGDMRGWSFHIVPIEEYENKIALLCNMTCTVSG
jgi:hypothetical protein